MRTPYPSPPIALRDLALLLHQWNAEVQRSMDEYHEHPFATCPHAGRGCNARWKAWRS